MGQQVTVRMPEDLLEKLDLRAALHRRRRSEVIRLALERFLAEPESASEPRPIDKVRDLIGSYESGIPDLGQRHREHHLRRLRHGR